MQHLPEHGRVTCTLCHANPHLDFDRSRTTEGDWRITYNPLSWGSTNPQVVVLGFSKGPTQAGALANSPHDEIAYKGSRKNVGKILAHIGLILPDDPNELKKQVDRFIADRTGPFHFASLIRCTVERYEHKTSEWKGSGGGMLDKFIATEFGTRVAGNCSDRFLQRLSRETRLIIMFGLGRKLNYVNEARKLLAQARPGVWRKINDVAYTDDQILVVHVEHFASQGALIRNWWGENDHPRSALGRQAKEAVHMVIDAQQVVGDGR